MGALPTTTTGGLATSETETPTARFTRATPPPRIHFRDEAEGLNFGKIGVGRLLFAYHSESECVCLSSAHGVGTRAKAYWCCLWRCYARGGLSGGPGER